nr:MAG TPA: hypothetical protein [Caudoviricetes sp.]
MPRPLQKWEEYRLLYCFPAGVSLVFLILVREQGVHSLGVHFRQHLHKAGLVAHAIVNLVDGSNLGVWMIDGKRTREQHGNHGSGLFAQLIDGKTSLFHGRNCRPGEFQNVLLAVVGNRNLLCHVENLLLGTFLFLVDNTCVGDGNGNLMGFICSLANKVTTQHSFPFPLALVASGGNFSVISLCTAKPQGIFFFLVLKRNKLVVGVLVIVTGELLCIGFLNAGFFPFHLVGKGGDVDKFGFTTHVREFLDVNKLFVSTATDTGRFVHEEGHVCNHIVLSFR